MSLPIRIDHVTHRYERSGNASEGVVAIRDVSLEIAPGSFEALMGASGSGKSTLLHLIGAIDRPSEGSIHLGERDITRLSEGELTLVRRESIGFVFQFFNLVPTLTVRENVRFPLDLLGRGRREQRVREIIERVGLLDRIDHYPSELSGGEMQRVAIARAIVHEPPILLADEPTGNLDSTTGASILRLLAEIQAERRLTVVMATHSDEAASHATRILTVADGRLIGAGA